MPVLFSPRRALLAVACLLSPAPAAAQRADGQVWTSLSASGALAGPLLGQAELVLRQGGDGLELYQREMRGALGVAVATGAALHLGYVRSTNFSRSGNRDEHRLYQQLDFALGRAVGGTVASRTRFEQRFVNGADATGLRLRQRLAYARALDRDRALTLFATAEAFVILKATSSAGGTGFERLRSAAGLRRAISDTIAIEVGYLNQYGRAIARADTMDHALTLALSYGF